MTVSETIFCSLSKETELLAASNLFDRAYYLRTYPDVANAGVDPLQHFITFGWREARNPNAYFVTTHYLHQFPFLRTHEINPLLHYMLSANPHQQLARRLADWFSHAQSGAVVRSPSASLRSPPQQENSSEVLRLFLHMPKCAGMSVQEMLLQSVQKDLILDYDSYFRTPLDERNELLLAAMLNPGTVGAGKIVYGHFFPIKYLGCHSRIRVKLVTILRDPIERLQSHYLFWKYGDVDKLNDHLADFEKHYLWKKMMMNHWSFMEFALSSEMQNFYAQYFSQISLSDFSFIGVFENIGYSIQRCFETLQLPVPAIESIPMRNMTNKKMAITLTDAESERLRKFHATDYLIYRYAQKKFHTN
ncbi:MAG: sulfotransferase family 2 domain-containing protein [Magnetococcales bacterium]|nr:sulfotransferase family 2 domain-containing protein [Magnetococcales bacterium]MBF0116681.1 sulfotransferase family 2 domain-containing protein [Magnetococcales bacterium]